MCSNRNSFALGRLPFHILDHWEMCSNRNCQRQRLNVGVILNLALFLCYHVLWPQGFEGNFDYISAIIAILAVVALFKFNQSVLRVIIGSALVGLTIKILL